MTGPLRIHGARLCPSAVSHVCNAILARDRLLPGHYLISERGRAGGGMATVVACDAATLDNAMPRIFDGSRCAACARTVCGRVTWWGVDYPTEIVVLVARLHAPDAWTLGRDLGYVGRPLLAWCGEQLVAALAPLKRRT